MTPGIKTENAGYLPFLSDPLLVANLHYLNLLFAEFCSEVLSADGGEIVYCVVEPAFEGYRDRSVGPPPAPRIRVGLHLTVQGRFGYVSSHWYSLHYTQEEADVLEPEEARRQFDETLEALRASAHAEKSK